MRITFDSFSYLKRRVKFYGVPHYLTNGYQCFEGLKFRDHVRCCAMLGTLDFRLSLWFEYCIYFLLGISPASNCSWPTFWNLLSVPSSKAGCTVYCTPSLWRWNWYRVPKRRPTTIWRRGNTQKKIYNIQITAKVWNQEKNCALSWYFEKSMIWCTVRKTSNCLWADSREPRE